MEFLSDTSVDELDNIRLREITSSFVRHMHAFVREVRLTEEEFELGVDFLFERSGRLLGLARAAEVFVVEQIVLEIIVIELELVEIAQRAGGCPEAPATGRSRLNF